VLFLKAEFPIGKRDIFVTTPTTTWNQIPISIKYHETTVNLTELSSK